MKKKKVIMWLTNSFELAIYEINLDLAIICHMLLRIKKYLLGLNELYISIYKMRV